MDLVKFRRLWFIQVRIPVGTGVYAGNVGETSGLQKKIWKSSAGNWRHRRKRDPLAYIGNHSAWEAKLAQRAPS